MAEEALKFLSDPATVASLGAIAAASMYYVISRPKPVTCVADPNNMSVEIPGDIERSRVCAFHPDLLEFLDENLKTASDAFLRGVEISGNSACLGKRHDSGSPYKWLSYNQILERVETFGCGLIELGAKPSTDTFIGIYSPNKIEWIVSEKACNLYSMVIVPLYDTLGPEAVSFIINQAKISIVVCDESKVELLLNHNEQHPHLKYIIKIGHSVTDEEKSKAESQGLQILNFLEVEELGRNHPHDKKPPKPNDLATICYTSGTTGNPKGAMITHKNIIAMMSAVIVLIRKMGFAMDHNDVYISYLPLPHMYERLMVCTIMTLGGRVGFYQGDIKLLMEDIKELKPTVFASVPRLLNRVYDKVTHQVSSSGMIKRFLYNVAMWFKDGEVKRGVVRQNSIWDYLVFKKIQGALGGNVKYIISGSAPLSNEVMNFLRCAMGCFVLEGYGQTETTAASTTQLVGDPTIGHVGVPLPCNKIKLVDVPDMGYFADKRQGEVCFWGYNVFKGYLYDPEKTAEVLDEDGWLHSGDIGEWLPNGALKLVDRKKHIFKLSQGEYIAPEKIENIYGRSKFVAQVYIYGDSFQSCVVGIIVPDVEVLKKWVPQNGFSGENMQEWCENQDINKAILTDLTAQGKKEGLFSFEQVKAIHLHPELFSVENGLLTPTFKSKRPELKKVFKQTVEQMYQRLSQSS